MTQQVFPFLTHANRSSPPDRRWWAYKKIRTAIPRRRSASR